MIRPWYALKLARTKLHSKRGMVAASVVVSGLLFAVLIAGISVFTAAEKSATLFIEKANDGHYLVKVSPVIPASVTTFPVPLDLKEVREIKAFQVAYYKSVKAKYEQLGIKYDTSIEVDAFTPSAWLPATLPEEQRVTVNFDSPVITAFLTQKYENYAKTAQNKLSDLQIVAAQYGGSGYYSVDRSLGSTIPSQLLIENGKENLSDQEMKADNLSLYGYVTNAMHNSSYSFADASLLKRYLVTSDAKELKGIPVVVTAQEVAKVFGHEKKIAQTEPGDPAEKRTWLTQIQEKFKDYTYQTCYRNAAEMAKIQKIQQDHAAIEAGKDDENYAKPSLIYNLPAETCGDITIKSDTRTAAEKQAEVIRVENEKKLGTYVEPAHQTVTYQIVGIMNAQPQSDYSTSAQGFLKNLLSVQDPSSTAYVPQQMYDMLPNSLKLPVEPRSDTALSRAAIVMTNAGLGSHVIAFSTIDQARAFIETETCPSMDTDCKRLFTSSTYGSNYLIMGEIGALFRNLLGYALPAVLALAALIIWFTMARVMAENRKETAVYRAMGAKRSDIILIYLMYSAIIAAGIALFAGTLGAAGAFAIDYFYGSHLTDIAISSFGVMSDDMKFRLFDLSSPLNLAILAAIFIVSFIAILQPLIRNVMRSPIEDMRGE
jgi:hypothetical protein